MKNLFLALCLVGVLVGCQPTGTEVLVSNEAELNEAIENAQSGNTIVMANGEWQDIRIRFKGKGTDKRPIVLRAETPGEVLIKGQSDLKLGGEYLIVDGLHFIEGFSPSNAVIEFAMEGEIANHSRVTNSVIKDFNKAQRNMQDLWVLFKGRDNQLDHSYLAGKSNRGPTIRVDLGGNENIYNYHKINNNHFGPRPPKGGPSAETIQIGNSYTSMTPSHTQVFENLFDRCDGEVEVISSKSNFNEFRNNVFYKSEGSLVTRHGNYCTIDGNYFIGDEESPHVGGVRLIGTGHWVTNNYFYNLRGEIFRAPIAVMNGIPRSSINRYIQVTDVNVAYNTFVNCVSPLQFGVGSNVDQKDVLPASEIRSLTPIRTTVANNIIFNEQGDLQPIVRHDSIDGIRFESNVINNQGTAFRGVEGLVGKDFSMTKGQDNVWIPTVKLGDIAPYNGFEYERIENDLFGRSRGQSNSVGATNGSDEDTPSIMDLSNYGPAWYEANPTAAEPTTHSAATVEELEAALSDASSGDIIQLTSDEYRISRSLKISKRLVIQSADSDSKPILNYDGEPGTPAFEMNPKGELSLQSVKLAGSSENYAFASLQQNMSSLYNLEIVDSEISNFAYVLKAYKYSFSQTIQIKNSMIKDCKNGIELSAEDDDRGDYNAENLVVINSRFERVSSNVIDYYRGVYDESTVGGTLVVRGCTFTNSGSEEENGTLVNTYGIINVDISDNTFKNNPVKLIARLWGAKNNSASNNTIENSGKIITEQNLPLKLMY